MVNSNGANLNNVHNGAAAAAAAAATNNRYAPSKPPKGIPSMSSGLVEELGGGLGAEMRSKAVESLIQPIINQLNFLSVSSSSSSSASFSSLNNKNDMDANGCAGSGSGNTKKGRSKRAYTLVESLVEAIENFLRQGSDLAHEYPEMKDEIMKACLFNIYFRAIEFFPLYSCKKMNNIFSIHKSEI